MSPKKQPIQPGQLLPKPRYIPGIGPSNAKLAFVGEAGGFEEDRDGLPFVGQAGKKLSYLCKEAKINRNECYITNVVKYRPPNNKIKDINLIGVSLEECILQLKHELEILKPNIIIALGEIALNALTGKKGIGKYRGYILESNFAAFKVLATYHPAALLYQERASKANVGDDNTHATTIGGETLVIADLIKAEKESYSNTFTRIPRKLEIIRSDYELYKFLNSYPNKKEVSIDIETSHSIPTCIALAFSPHHSISIPLLGLGGVDGGIHLSQAEYISIYKTLSEFLNRPDIRFIGQNFKFDHEKLQSPSKILGYSKDKLAADTSLMMGVAYSEFPKNLSFMTSLFTNEPFYKDEGKEFNPKKDKAERLLIYNAKDAAVTLEIKLKLDQELEDLGKAHNRDLKGFYYNFVNKLHDFYMDIEHEGLDVDFDRRTQLHSEYTKLIDSKHIELELLIGHEFNVRSNPSVRTLIEKELQLPSRDNYQEETIVALLGNHTTKDSRESKILSLILEERQLRTNFNYLKQEPDPDGRMRTSYRITGTETGRSSTSILDAPLRPTFSYRKDGSILKPIKQGMAFQTIPKHGPFAKAIRSIFVSPPGYVFVEADLSQAEARIVAILADDDYTLNLFNTTDIHTETASWIFGCSPKDITSNQRFIGKVCRHAGNYGEGKRTLMLSVNADAKKFGLPLQISELEAGIILNTFHTRTPKIRRIFQNEVRAIVGKTRTLFNPFGRMRQFFGIVKDTETYAQIPQSTVPDHVRMAGLRIRTRRPNIRICAETHDALLFKLKEDNWELDARIIKEEFEVPIDFRNCSLSRGQLVIPCDIQMGNRYSELKKVKL